MQFHNEQPAKRTGDVVVSTLLTATLAVSVLAGILEALELAVPYIAIILTGCIGAALMQMLFLAEKKTQTLGTLAIVGLPCIVVVFFSDLVASGVAILCNRVLECVGADTGVFYLPFSVAEGVSGEISFAVVAIILMLWMTCGSSYLQRESHPFISICILLVMLIINGWLPQEASSGWVLITGFCIGLLFVRHHLGDKKQFPMAVLLVLCISGVVWAGAMVTGAPLEKGKTQVTTTVQQTICDSIAQSRYGKGENRSMPMGDFKNLGDLQFSDAEMLKITGENYRSLYLRGFVGGVFDGARWNSVDGKTLYEKGQTFYWLHDSGYYGQNLLAKSALILDPESGKGEELYKIENLGADGRVYYTPYEVTDLRTEGQTVLENQLLAEDAFAADGWNGWTHYEIKTLENQVKRYPELILTLIENLKGKKLADFRKAESHYNRFVYENYTYLSKDEQKLMEKYLGKADIKKGSHMAYEEAKTLILQCLDKNVVYSEKLLSDSEENFIKNFLENDRSGYSVHYATTAALMFRHFGIPARYVEGYLITPEAAKEAKGCDAMILTDKDAHAWVEYYQDGIGWLPFETTPPYRDVMEQPEQLQSANQQSVSESGATSLGMEMIEDNYEPDELEREEEKRSLPWGTIAISGLLLILLILAVLTGLYLWNRRKKVRAIQASFHQDDLNQAVEAIFRYCMLLHDGLGIRQKNCSVYDYGPEIGSIAGDELKETYLCAAKIYQKAVYSHEVVSNEEWKLVMAYKEALLHTLKEICSLPKRLSLRWVQGLY